MSESGTVEGTGQSLDDAVRNALSKVPQPEGADILTILEVEKFGYKIGGFVGFSEFWVVASYKFG